MSLLSTIFNYISAYRYCEFLTKLCGVVFIFLLFLKEDMTCNNTVKYLFCILLKTKYVNFKITKSKHGSDHYVKNNNKFRHINTSSCSINFSRKPDVFVLVWNRPSLKIHIALKVL